MRLNDRVAVITGAASGIGRATALALAAEGARVVVADQNEAGGREVVEQVQAAGGAADFFPVDVTDYRQVVAAVDFAVERWGTLDIMFNNAGVAVFKPLLEHEPEDFDRVVKVNQYGVYHGILAAARKMRELGVRGTIVNTASVYAFLAAPGLIGYHAAKGAVKMMTQSAALDLARYGIRVIAIAPGVVDTPIIQGYRDADMLDAMARKHLRRKLLAPEQIAGVVVLLVSDAAAAINGSVVMVDDGYAEFK